MGLSRKNRNTRGELNSSKEPVVFGNRYAEDVFADDVAYVDARVISSAGLR